MTRAAEPLGCGDDLHEQAFAREHQVLEGIMARLFERDRTGAQHSELMQILEDLEARTADHFRNEEAYMASIDYCGLLAHQRVHRQLLCELARQRIAFARSPGSLPPRLQNFLRNWLAAHIEDGHLKQRGFAAMSRLRGDVG